MTDIKIGLTSAGTTYSYTLSPGCTITRSANKEVSVFPIEGGKSVELMTLGRMESDTIRIDAKCILNDPGELTGLPPYVPVHTITSQLIAQITGDPPDQVNWGSETFFGRIKSIVVTESPGQGDMYDLAVTFLVGTCIDST